MTVLEIRAGLLLQGKYLTDIARDLNLSPATITETCKRTGKSRRVAKHIAKVLGKPLTKVFPEYKDQ